MFEHFDLLDGPAGGPDQLKAIMARARRRKAQWIGGAAAALLVVGGGTGLAVANHGGGTTKTQMASAGSSSRGLGGSPIPGVAASSATTSPAGAFAGTSVSSVPDLPPGAQIPARGRRISTPITASGSSSGSTSVKPAPGSPVTVGGTSGTSGSIGTVPPAPGTSKPFPAVPSGWSLAFTRQSGDIAIKGYVVNQTTPLKPLPESSVSATCAATAHFAAQLSSPAAGGTLTDYANTDPSSTSAVLSAYGGTYGSAATGYVDAVVVHTSSSVTSVKVTFTNGMSDEMTPVQGWSVLASSVSTPPSTSAGLGDLQVMTRIGAAPAVTKVYTGPSNLAPTTGTSGSASTACGACSGPVVMQPATGSVASGGYMCPMAKPGTPAGGNDGGPAVN